nr:hypothetical protein [Polymorphobacter sp.]
MPTFTGQRGELTRTRQQILDSGGLVPKLALTSHAGGFGGFVACTNKTAGVLGCKCDRMDAYWMNFRAVAIMRAFATNPDHIATHTAFNTVGLLSWAGPGGQPYGGQQTSYRTPNLTVYSFEDGEDALVAVHRRLEIALPPTKAAVRAFRQHQAEFAMSADMSVLAMIVKKDLEYSFFTPVAAGDIVFGAVEPVNEAEDPIGKKLRLLRIDKDKEPERYEMMRLNFVDQANKQSQGFQLLSALAVPIVFANPMAGLGPREPQPYSGLGVGRRESVYP